MGWVCRNSNVIATALVGLLHLNASSTVNAATLNVVDGGLVGASGINISGSVYNVEFVDGTCAGVFTGCDEPSDFAFQTGADSLLAAQALIDFVFIDGPDGNFNSQPWFIPAGLDLLAGAEAIIPYSFSQEDNILSVASALNNCCGDPDRTFGPFDAQYEFFGDTTFDPLNAVLGISGSYRFWAVFVKTDTVSPPSGVPLPATALLLGGALVGLAGFRNRKRRLASRSGT